MTYGLPGSWLYSTAKSPVNVKVFTAGTGGVTPPVLAGRAALRAEPEQKLIEPSKDTKKRAYQCVAPPLQVN